MKLTDEQIDAVRGWATAGETLNGIQSKLKEFFGLRLTYLDTRLLLGDLGVELDEWKPRPAEPEPDEDVAEAEAVAVEPEPEPAGGVVVTVDKITRIGAMVSGRVTFSDGAKAAWYFAADGRLGMESEKPGYRPPPADVQQFQVALDRELRRLGM
jgi:hypothetical protein